MMNLENVVPFGRSFDEYSRIFALTERDARGGILGVGDGPASFNATATRRHWRVVSVDPIYRSSPHRIGDRFHAVVDDIIEQVRSSPGDWIWSYHRNPESLRAHRHSVLQEFLADFPSGCAEGRYVVGQLPTLPFEVSSFQLALCSHLLFLYSEVFDLDFHTASIREMLRVAHEVRIFPLLNLDGSRSRHIDAVVARLTEEGYRASTKKIDYELQKNGNELLSVSRPPIRAPSLWHC